jgi:hypothetical protein
MTLGLTESYGLYTPFAYVTVPEVRAQGILNETDDPEFGIDDGPLRDHIKTMSHWINRLTNQWFLPVRLKQPVDSGRSSIAAMPNQIPILELFNLSLERPNLVSFNYPSVSFVVKPRYVMMVTRHTRLPDYPYFINLDGAFGWLINNFTPARTTLVTDVVPTTGAIAVADASKIRVGDALLVGNNPEPNAFHLIVEAVDPGTGIVTYDPLLTFRDPEVKAGAKVVNYGRVPDLIKRATFLMIRDRIPYKIGEIDTFEDPFGKGTRLNSESVEGYSYSMGGTPAQNGHAGGSWTTGNVEVDDILQQYAAPNMFLGMA